MLDFKKIIAQKIANCINIDEQELYSYIEIPKDTKNGENDDKDFVKNEYAYLKTKFVRFLLLQAISSINLSKDKFQFIPLQDFSKSWTDEELYKKYNLTEEEIAFIESMIRPMD